MAVWEHRDEPALACLRTAIRTVVEILALVNRFQARHDLPRPLLIGIGINTGLASIGNLGSGVTSDYTALGDVVNKAFRLESSTRVLDADLAFGEEVRQTLNGLPIDSLASAYEIKLKGYAEACTVYAMRAAAVSEFASPIENALSRELNG
jgi:adenylate cyclase